MSVLIKGMEMPMSGDVLDILVFPNGEVQKRCSVNAFHLVRKASAVPVPTPHGRLIDADSLIAEHEEAAYSHAGASYGFHMAARSWVMQAPTIIEAEVEE